MQNIVLITCRSSLNWKEVILLFGVALGLLPHSVECAQAACVASWGGKRVNKTDFLGSSRIWRIRPVLLCPGLILGAFDSNAEEAWVCSSDYVAQDAIFIYFNPIFILMPYEGYQISATALHPSCSSSTTGRADR